MLLTDKIRAAILASTRRHQFLVMTRENMAMIAKDMGLNLECVEGACEVETGRNIGADYVVSGSVVKMGRTLICTIKVHETRDGSLLGAGETRGSDPINILDAIPGLVDHVMRTALAEHTPAVK
jgi:TolB-like protein